MVKRILTKYLPVLLSQCCEEKREVLNCTNPDPSQVWHGVIISTKLFVRATGMQASFTLRLTNVGSLLSRTAP